MVLNNIDPPHTHDLVELCNLCATHDQKFLSILSYCVSLNPYGVHVRYPNELSVDDTITEHAIENTKKLFEFCCNSTNIKI